MKLYPGEHSYYQKPTMYYARTGEFRPPKKGEFYLSGAIPCAYRAPNDLSTSYHIMREAEPEETQCKCCKQLLPIGD